MNVPLISNLKRLRLSGLASTLEVRLQEATGNQLNHLEFLELIVNDELAIRDDRAIARRIKKAGFRELKSLPRVAHPPCGWVYLFCARVP